MKNTITVPYKSTAQTYNMRKQLKEMGYKLGKHYHYSVIANSKVIFIPIKDIEKLSFLFTLVWDEL